MDRTFSRFPAPSTESIDFAIEDTCDQCGSNGWHRLDNDRWLCHQCGSESSGDPLEGLFFDPKDRSGRALRRVRRQKARKAKKRRSTTERRE